MLGENIVIVSRCLVSNIDEVRFHFDGVWQGEEVKMIKVKFKEGVNVSPVEGREYILKGFIVKLEDTTLHVEIAKIKEV